MLVGSLNLGCEASREGGKSMSVTKLSMESNSVWESIGRGRLKGNVLMERLVLCGVGHGE